MDIEEFSKSESGLKMAIGYGKFETVVGEISDIVYKNNLDVTPTILNDLFDYIIKFIQISKI